MRASTCLPIDDSSQVGAARRRLSAFASAAGFDEIQISKLGTVATEAANNLLKHAGRGSLVYRLLPSGAVEVLALDRGPGMAHVSRCLEDGYSTAGTPGTGLGAIRRMSSHFDVFSAPGLGTALLSVVSPRSDAEGAARPRRPESPWTVGAVCVPVAGEELCGDGWDCQFDRDGGHVLLSDGLGHGPAAHQASEAAIAAFAERPSATPSDAVQSIHQALRATRGAAVGVARIEGASRIVRFAGVGNTMAVLVSPAGRSRHLVSQSGTAGLAVRKVSEFMQAWEPGSLLVMATDGIQTRWDISGYPGLFNREPSLIAGVIYRDFGRGKDDATVVVVKDGGDGA